MRVYKESAQMGREEITPEELELINMYAKSPLTAQQVFTFSLLLCDNEIDRDGECFPIPSLERLCELLPGTTGITDHSWSASNQIARVYRAEVVKDPAKQTSYGEEYAYLKAWAYMLDTEANGEIIAQIKGGIKKEVSIGCSVKTVECSICSRPIGENGCPHIRGQEYDGTVCRGLLKEPEDVYEWSFVAVPSQTEAGVMKRFAPSDCGTFKEYVERSGREDFIVQYEGLRKRAKLGDEYIESVKKEVIKLGLLSGMWHEDTALANAAGKLDFSELMSLKTAFEKRVDELYPPESQLYRESRELKKSVPETEFMV